MMKTKSKWKENSIQNDVTIIIKDYIEIFYYSVIHKKQRKSNQPAKLQEESKKS